MPRKQIIQLEEELKKREQMLIELQEKVTQLQSQVEKLLRENAQLRAEKEKLLAKLEEPFRLSKPIDKRRESMSLSAGELLATKYG